MPVKGMRPFATAAALVLAVTAVTAVASPAEGSGPRPRAAGPVDWPTYHGTMGRTGYAPTMPAASGPLHVTHQLDLDGQVYASPIVINDRTIVATENNTVYKFGPHYNTAWQIHLGAPSPGTERPCGNIDPLGITGTPVYGYAENVVYVAAELGHPARHRLYAIDFDTGTVRWSRSLDMSGVDQKAMQERGALAISGSHVFIPFGGLAGDCGQYKGRVIGVPLNGEGTRMRFTVPTEREAGIWAPPGPTVDVYHHLYVAVGNGESGVGDPYDFSDSVLKLSDVDLTMLSSFSPTTWPTDNDADLDLGSMGPALIAGKWVLTVGKSGTGYVLSKADLGGIGGSLAHRPVCRAFGGSAVVGHIVYVPCTDGVRAVQVSDTPRIKLVWRAAPGRAGSPVVGGNRVWTVDAKNGVLYGLDPATGADVSSVSVGVTSRFATPAIYGNRLVVPTLAGIAVVSTS